MHIVAQKQYICQPSDQKLYLGTLSSLTRGFILVPLRRGSINALTYSMNYIIYQGLDLYLQCEKWIATEFHIISLRQDIVQPYYRQFD